MATLLVRNSEAGRLFYSNSISARRAADINHGFYQCFIQPINSEGQLARMRGKGSCSKWDDVQRQRVS
jgi:hypothetical protein